MSMRKYGVPYRLPNGRVNPAWSHGYYLAHKAAKRQRGRTYYFAHRERMLAIKKEWALTHRERVSETQRQYSLEIKKQAILKTNGKITCAIIGCGCDDLAILQANYIPGGHSNLTAIGKLPSGGLVLYRDIAFGRIDANLFNFLCPPHNSVNHLELVRDKFIIRWTG
jgi:hypothetical protein